MINSRFFAFGCSATRCNWPTWADIVARNHAQYENWAIAGAGNPFIFYSLMECHKRHIISSKDTVMIMWTNIGREDRYVKGEGWLTPGSIYNQEIYDENFVKKYADPTGYLIRDMAHLSSVKTFLDMIGCQYKFFSTVPFNVPDDNIFRVFSIDTKITNLYKDELASVAPSVYEILFNFDWYSLPGYKDLVKLEKEYNQLRGSAWPNWDRFTQQDWTDVPARVREEIDEKYDFSKRFLSRTNTHLLPAEHLLYLDRVAGDLEIPESTRQWTAEVNQAILENQNLKPLWTPPRKPVRF